VGSINREVFLAINHWPEWLAPMMRFFSEATNYLWVKIALAVLLIALIYRGGNVRRAAVHALIAFPISDGLTNVLKHVWPMHRPFQEISAPECILRAGWSDSMGTASAHSANMAVVAYVFVYHLGWKGSPWVLVALITGFSRVYNGVHYPYQVLLGWTCGIFIGFLVTQISKLILRKPANVEIEKVSDEVEPA